MTKRAILIVGDWVIDEYWFLVEHQSEKSTHTGLSHYRISSKRGENIADLCAAGHMARVLYKINNDKSPDLTYDICGIGSWHPGDTNRIRHLFHHGKDCQPVAPLFQLRPNKCREKQDDLKSIHLETLDAEGSTIRIIRQYQKRGNDLVQISRVDWEPPQNPKQKESRKIDKVIAKFKEYDIQDVVIYDSGKGVVDEKVINALVDKYSKSHWYVLSKSDKPAWMTTLKGALVKPGSLELVIIRPELAATLNPWDTWLIGNRMSVLAKEVIEGYRIKYKARNIILLSERHEVVAYMNDLNGKHCITAKSHVKPDSLKQLGWSSAFMAAMVHMIATDRTRKKETDVRNRIKKAIELADELSSISGSPGDEKKRQPVEDPEISEWDWDIEKREWYQATTGMGIIQHSTEEGPRLDVWRGAIELPGYIAITKEKRDALVNIGQHLRAFKRQSSPSRPLSIMLVGDPGSGKTILAKSLADIFDFQFFGYNITQMIRREELLNIFERVATTQTTGSKVPLVFVDEINAFLEGEPVYSLFLSPLEEGQYFRHGNAFSLKPCIWVFAGTHPQDKKQDATPKNDSTMTLIQPKPAKQSDFESRMTLMEYLDYSTLSEQAVKRALFKKLSKIEQVYIGAKAINTYFPDVNKVSKDTLKKFANYPSDKSTSRSIRKFVISMKNVQYGAIKSENWTDGDKGSDPTEVSLNFNP
jgi:hypothetical protein